MAKHRTGYLFKRGATFYVSWRVAGKAFSKALYDAEGNPITNRRDAEDAKVKIMAPFTVADEAAALESVVAKLGGRQAELARLQDQQNPALTIAAAWAEFLKTSNRPDSGDSTLRQYKCQFSAFSKWSTEKHPAILALRSVSKSMAEEYASHLITGKLSPNTYNKHLNLLTLVFRVLKEKAKITENPWADIQRKHLTTQSRRELTLDELKKVCLTAEGELRVLLAMGVYTGLRLGDCSTLRWINVDLDRGIILRIPNKTARRNPKPVQVPIHPTLQGMLAGIPSDQRGDYVLPKTAERYLIRIDLVTDQIQAHFKECGIKLHKPGTGKDGKRAVIEVGFHSLRHTFVSLSRESNAPLSVVESIVGHNSPAMTRHYTHVGELAARKAVGALPDVTSNAKPAPVLDTHPVGKMPAIQALVKAMAPDNWRANRELLLSILSVDEPITMET